MIKATHDPTRRFCARRPGLARHQEGSVHVLEAMIVGVMVVGAVVAVSTMDEPVSQSEGFRSSQGDLVQDALDNLAAQPSHDSSQALFGSLLEEYLMKAVAGDTAPLSDYLNRSLPAGSQYNVYLDTGFGRPLPVFEGGTTPGESMAGTANFVPKLAYIFMIPEFEQYQGNFHMNVLAMPVHNNILLQDEGDPIELSVTFTSDSQSKPVTIRSYGQSALRYNDPDGRSWGSVSLYTPSGQGGPAYYLDGSRAHLFDHPSPEVELNDQNVTLEEAYNVTIPITVHETADHSVPRGAQISVEFPRGWEFTPEKQDWVERGEEPGNADHWGDFQWYGGLGEGWTINASLKQPLRDESVMLNLSGDYRMLTDPSYPYLQPIVIAMGGGVQGKSTLLLDMGFREDVYASPERSLPAIDFSSFGEGKEIDESEELALVGGLRRDAYLSLPKPIISGTKSTWGLNFANLGEEATIEKIEVRQPGGLPLMTTVEHASGWKHGVWNQEGPGHFSWVPTREATVGKGEAAWLGLEVATGSTGDNHYRNQDYLDMLLDFSPDNTPEGSAHKDWTFTQRAHHMSGDGIYRQLVPPAMNVEGWPGWPNEAPSYWFGAEAKQQQRVSIGNGTYAVDASGTFSQLFGDYQGSHVFSSVHLEDPKGVERRNFEVGERVHIKNDFSALFSQLSVLREDQDRYPNLDFSRVEMQTSIYTPDVAWMGKPSQVFTESADLALSFGEFRAIFPSDITGNNIEDVILVNNEGLIYALDGRDGSKLWHHDTLKMVHHAFLSDVTSNGKNELVVASSDNMLHAFDTSLEFEGDGRLLWSVNLDPSKLELGGVPPFEITATEDLTRGTESRSDATMAVAMSASSGGSAVLILNSTRSEEGWNASVIAVHESSSLLTKDARISDVALVGHVDSQGTHREFLAMASLNGTVTLLSLPGLEPEWITNIPHPPMNLATVDLNHNGWDDIIVNTGPKSANDKKGDRVYMLPGNTGNLGPTERDFGFLTDEEIQPQAANVLPDGRILTVGDHRLILEDLTGLYDEPLIHPPTGCVSTGGDLDDLLDDLIEGQAWTNMHLEKRADTEVIYLISSTGAILSASEACASPYDTLEWVVVDEGMDSDMAQENERFIAVHANQSKSGLELFKMSDNGKIREKDGFMWLPSHTTVCFEVDCSIPTRVVEWQVEEGEDGGAERFWALVAQEPEVTDAAEPTAHLLSVAPDEYGDWIWDRHAEWSGIHPTTLRFEDDESIWVAGGDRNGSPFIAHRGQQAESFDAEYFSGGNASGPFASAILDVLPTSDGSVWALDVDGQAWRRAEEGIWVSYPTRAEGRNEAGVLVEDPDGTVWAFLDDYRHFPLATHIPHAEVEMISLEVPGSPEQVSIQIESEEGHLGGDDVDSDPVTRIQWFVREAGTHNWQSVDRDDSILQGTDSLPSLAKLPLRGYQGNFDCPCDTLEFKAVLETRTLPEDDGVRQDAGMTPLLRGTTIELTSSEGYSRANIPPGSVSTQDSGAVFSPYLGGIVLEKEAPAWGYRGIQNTGNPYVEGSEYRFITKADAVTGNTTGPQVVIVEQGAHHLQWNTLEGDSGLPIQQDPQSAFNTLEGASVREVLIGDLTGDQLENIVMLGKFQGDDHAAVVWNEERQTMTPVETTTVSPVSVGALTGMDSGRQTLTFAVPASRTAVVGGEEKEVGYVQSWYGSFDETKPKPRWGVQPLESQGHTTFSYTIPRNSLFGTSAVVSELVFDMTKNGTTSTQSARLMERFDIQPPGRTHSVPAIYTVEVVAWHDEGQSRIEANQSGAELAKKNERGFEIKSDINTN